MPPYLFFLKDLRVMFSEKKVVQFFCVFLLFFFRQVTIKSYVLRYSTVVKAKSTTSSRLAGGEIVALKVVKDDKFMKY